MLNSSKEGHRMFKRLGIVVLITIAVGAMSSAGQKSGVDRLDWMSGCWAFDDGKERIEESWLKPAGLTMIGMSRTVAGGKTVFTEHTQIGEVNGQIAYTVSLGLGVKPVAFKLIKISDREAVFENPEHDFPRRIIYRRESADALFARIEGKKRGVDQAVDYHYNRSRCD
jgi:hypothetical protein